VSGIATSQQLPRQLARDGLLLRSGPFVFKVQSRISSIADNIARLYPGMIEPYAGQAFADFHVAVNTPPGLRSLFYRQAQFYLDEKIIFNPFPIRHATAMLEWSMNWCVSTQIDSHLIVHAAVLERNGAAVVMPAPPGAGKSTLCAALSQEGWRLLSDELTLFDLHNGWVWPMTRPISLKNASIEIIRQRYPQAVFGTLSHDTLKGSVTHIRPPAASVAAQHQSCPVAWIVFPSYQADADAELSLHSKGETLLRLAENAFNYSRLGVDAFKLLRGVVDGAQCYQFRYSRLDEAIAAFARMAGDHG
jgi:HprK-related kinase A